MNLNNFVWSFVGTSIPLLVLALIFSFTISEFISIAIAVMFANLVGWLQKVVENILNN